MRKGTGAIAAILAIAALAGICTAGVGAYTEPSQKCGAIVLEQIGVYAIQTSGVRCPPARQIAKQWLATLRCGVPECWIGKFRCRGRALARTDETRTGERTLSVRCGYSGRLVRFNYGTVLF